MQDWNRKKFQNYFEVFLDVPMDILIKRDTKKIYESAIKGKMKNVVGIDIDLPKPKISYLIINDQNDKFVSIDNCVDDIIY